LNPADVDSPPPPHQFRSNPVFWIMWLLPAAAVVAGLATLVIALRNADRALPTSYHWEGEHLDQDFARQRLAASHGIEVDVASGGGECAATLRHAPDDPVSLTLTFTHSSDAGLDRVVLLRRVQPGQYRGTCAPLPPGRWHVALEDEAGAWAIRARFDGGKEWLVLRARDPGPA
jgi:uncharacterized protein